jgi:nitroreductase
MELDDAIKERHSIRRFTTKKPSYDELIACIDAANSSPLAGNIPTLRFIVVDDKEIIEKIAEGCQQSFIENAKFLVVVCSDPSQCVRSYNERGNIYSRQQAGAAIENFLLRATDLGLASCWVGAFADEIIKRILVIPESANVEAILPLGYEMPKAGKQRKKGNLDSTLFFNKWKQKNLKPWKKPEAM